MPPFSSASASSASRCCWTRSPTLDHWLDLLCGDAISVEDPEQGLQSMAHPLRSFQRHPTPFLDHRELCPQLLLGDLIQSFTHLQLGEQARSSSIESFRFLLGPSSHRLFPLRRLQLNGGEGRRGDRGILDLQRVEQAVRHLAQQPCASPIPRAAHHCRAHQAGVVAQLRVARTLAAAAPRWDRAAIWRGPGWRLASPAAASGRRDAGRSHPGEQRAWAVSRHWASPPQRVPPQYRRRYPPHPTLARA